MGKGLSGVFVDFLVVVRVVSTSVSSVVPQLNIVNNGLSDDQGGSGLNFLPGFISGKYNIICKLFFENVPKFHF